MGWRNRYTAPKRFLHYGEPTGPGEFSGVLDYPTKEDAEAAADDFLAWLSSARGVIGQHLGAFDEGVSLKTEGSDGAR